MTRRWFRSVSLVIRLKRESREFNDRSSTGLRLFHWMLSMAMLLVACRAPPPPLPPVVLPPIEDLALTLSPDSIDPGESITIHVVRDGESVARDPDYECEISANYPYLERDLFNGCSAKYTCPSEKAPPIVRIDADVYFAGEEIDGLGPRFLQIEGTLPARTMIVLDMSQRMGVPCDHATTRLAGAKSEIRERVKDTIRDAPVGLRVFGGPSEEPDDCKNSKLLERVRPNNQDRIREALKAIELPSRKAALWDGMRQAIDDLITRPGYDPDIISYRLVTWTGGGCDCELLSAKAVEQQLGATADPVPQLIAEGKFVFETIAIGVCTSQYDDDRFADHVDDLRARGISAYYIQAPTADRLARATDYVLRLGSSSPIDVLAGYHGLAEFLWEQEDTDGIALMEERLYDLGLFEPIEWGVVPWTLLSFKVQGEASRGLWEPTIADLRTLIERDKENSRLYFLRGVALWNTGSFDLAIADLEMAGKLDTSWGLPQFGKGLVTACTDPRAAAGVFDNAFERDPDVLDSPFFKTFPSEARVPAFYKDFACEDVSPLESTFFSNATFFTDLIVLP